VFQRTARSQEDVIIRPLLQNSITFYGFLGTLLILIGWFLYAWFVQLTQGLGVTAMRTPVGAAWGIYIANFVFFACMAHGGMAVSAAVRLLKLNMFKPIARMGEVLTAVALMMAGLSIIIDLGRPDRAFNMVLYYPQRIASSPLVWDMTVIIVYFTLSASYLWLTMRKDLLQYADRFSKRGLLYQVLLIGYSPDQEKAIERVAWWLSIAILILIVMLSGGVIPWIFGLQVSRPGWFGAMAGPYFLTAALASSVAAVIVIAAILRRIYHWQSYIKPEIFRGLAIVLGALTHLYIYLTFTEQFTMLYAGPHADVAVSEIVLQGRLAPIFWPMLIVGFALPAVFLVAQAVSHKWFNLTGIAVSALVILLAFWVKRFIIVVPSFLRPLLPFPSGSYAPSWVEWSIIAGAFALAILLYTLFLKIFPVVEAGEE
jgi:molybdopterin-containing oxidoreductase family membrane subunit